MNHHPYWQQVVTPSDDSSWGRWIHEGCRDRTPPWRCLHAGGDHATTDCGPRPWWTPSPPPQTGVAAQPWRWRWLEPGRDQARRKQQTSMNQRCSLCASPRKMDSCMREVLIGREMGRRRGGAIRSRRGTPSSWWTFVSGYVADADRRAGRLGIAVEHHNLVADSWWAFPCTLFLVFANTTINNYNVRVIYWCRVVHRYHRSYYFIIITIIIILAIFFFLRVSTYLSINMERLFEKPYSVTKNKLLFPMLHLKVLPSVSPAKPSPSYLILASKCISLHQILIGCRIYTQAMCFQPNRFVILLGIKE